MSGFLPSVSVAGITDIHADLINIQRSLSALFESITSVSVATPPGGSPGQVQVNSAGAFGGLTNAALTALIQTFTTSLSGAVPSSPGGTTDFLRADGTWAAVPGSTGPGGSPGQVQYNNTGAFGGLTNTALTALIQNFTGSLSGAAPSSGGGTTNYLRADATWATPFLFGTSGSIGGGALGAGAVVTGTVSITGATTGMCVVASPVSYPGNGFVWSGYVSSSNVVTVVVTAVVAGTPSATAYNVRVIV